MGLAGLSPSTWWQTKCWRDERSVVCAGDKACEMRSQIGGFDAHVKEAREW